MGGAVLWRVALHTGAHGRRERSRFPGGGGGVAPFRLCDARLRPGNETPHPPVAFRGCGVDGLRVSAGFPPAPPDNGAIYAGALQRPSPWRHHADNGHRTRRRGGGIALSGPARRPASLRADTHPMAAPGGYGTDCHGAGAGAGAIPPRPGNAPALGVALRGKGNGGSGAVL